MNRMYELAIVTEPRQTDEDVQALTARMHELIEQNGAEVYHTDDWGKRKLAYPIRKFNEARYTFLYSRAGAGQSPSWETIERLLQQDERVLRHLVVRTDEGLKRALRKAKVMPEVPGMDEEALREFLGVPESVSRKKSEVTTDGP